MWVTYVQNLETRNSMFQYVRAFIKPEANGTNTSYNIGSTFFDGEESFPFKIYNPNNVELLCYCCKDNSGIKDLNESNGNKLLNATAVVSLKFLPDAAEDVDETYSASGFPVCDSSFYQASKDLAIDANAFGVSASKFWPGLNNNFRFQIESNSVLELVADVEIFKFLASTVFRSVHGKFAISRSPKESFLSVEIFLKKKLSDQEEEEILKLPLTVNLEEGVLKISAENPDLNLKRLISDILSCFSP